MFMGLSIDPGVLGADTDPGAPWGLGVRAGVTGPPTEAGEGMGRLPTEAGLE